MTEFNKAYESGKNGMRIRTGEDTPWYGIWGYHGEDGDGPEGVSIHTYGPPHYRAIFGRIPHEEFVKMVNAMPGYEVTYTPPRKKNVDVVRDLPVGAIFKWPNTEGFYVRQSGEELGSVVASSGHRHYVTSFDHSDHNPIEVVYNPDAD